MAFFIVTAVKISNPTIIQTARITYSNMHLNCDKYLQALVDVMCRLETLQHQLNSGIDSSCGIKLVM
jgi:hypothetical protein